MGKLNRADWWDLAGALAWLASFLIITLAGCGGPESFGSGPCLPRDGRAYTVTVRLVACAPGVACATGNVFWTYYSTFDGDACEVVTEDARITMTLDWSVDGGAATGTLVIRATDPPTPGPSPGTYSVKVVPYVAHGAS